MEVRLQPKQEQAFLTTATEVLYGGAAGGGKSFYERVSAIRWAFEVPGIQVYLFRRTFPDLLSNHLRGPTSFHILLGDAIAQGLATWKGTDHEFAFKNGSSIKLAHCQYEDDVQKYQGAEIHVLIMDELTHFTEHQYRFLRSRVRLAGLKVPERYRDKLPRIEAASNPGSVGHAFVKRTFVTPKAPGEIWRAPPDEGGMLRQYIPAKLSDNPALTSEDPQYEQRLDGLGTPELVRAMKDGDWNIIAGQAFEKLRRDTHAIKPFKVPKSWTRFRSFDWGSTRPFSVGWWAVADGTLDAELPNGKILIPRGALVRYAEWYGWNGQPNQGARMESHDVAKGILARDDQKVAYGAADPSIFNRTDGPSISEKMAAKGVVWIRANNDRHNGYSQVRDRVAGEDLPMLYAFDSCHDGFWRTMPDLVMDKHDPEDIDTELEDHPYDDVRYGCMSRPWIRDAVKPAQSTDRYASKTTEVKSWRVG